MSDFSKHAKIIICLFCISLQAFAQYMVIHESGGSETRIALSEITKLTFDLSDDEVSENHSPGETAEKLKMAMAKILPNPFSPRVEYSLETASAVRILVFDIKGRKIRTLQHGKVSAGAHVVNWDLTNDQGLKVSTGSYILSVLAENKAVSQNLFIVQ